MKHRMPYSTISLGFGILPRAAVKQRSVRDAAPVRVRKPSILIVDADPAQRRSTASRLSAAHFAVQSADSAQAALDSCIRSRPNLVLTDLHPGDMGGISFLKELRSRWPQMTITVLTARGTIREAVEATQCGAFSYLTKPIEPGDLVEQIQRAVAASTFNPRSRISPETVVSRSQLMEDRLAIANRAAHCDLPVLLTGENGTGKELLARAIHAASPRRNQSFVTVACKGRPNEMLEAELFGGEVVMSALRRAQGGTLLLDEVGELPFHLQVALSCAIKEHPRPSSSAGGANVCPAPKNARIICTTSRDLQALVRRGAFFRDLLEQINILPIEIPPLGRRREDIPLLVSHFLERTTATGGQRKIYSPRAIELLATADWPGNVRQLFDLVKQHVALSRDKVISREFVERSLGPQPAGLPSYDEARDQFCREFLAANLRRARGNVSAAARFAQRNRTEFYRLLERYRLHAQDFKDRGNVKDHPPEVAVAQ